MVRRNRSPLSGLTNAEVEAITAQMRQAFRDAGLLRDADAGGIPGSAVHQPFRGRHRHPHYAAGHHSGDSGGTHEHWHTHGSVDGGQVSDDADHDHVHDESAFGTTPPPDDPPAGQARSQPARHIRFQHGQAVVLNRAGDNPWARLAGQAREIQEGQQ